MRDLYGFRVNVIADEETWDAYQYNPPQYDEHYVVPDTREWVSPKPTWAEVMAAVRRGRIGRSAQDADRRLGETDQVRGKLTDDTVLSDPDVYIGGGLDHMTGLARMATAANLAGRTLPQIVMRTASQRKMAVHTIAQLTPILDAAAARENLVESAHNIVVAKYKTFAALRDDENQTLEVREASAAVASGIVDNYEGNLKAAMDAYDPDAMPDDLPTLKAVCVERLEAAALGRDKQLRGHLTNQGVMLHPSCIDQATAMQEVAEAHFHGTAAIRKSADAEKALKAFDKAKAVIEAVEVLNTPVIKVNGLPPTGEEYPLAQVLVSADHPNANVAGEVEIIEVRVRGGALKKDSTKYHSATDTTTDHSVELVVDPQMFASVVIRARNICGVSRAVVELRNPIQKEE